ncbi:MAG: tRNA uridine(34) 5-carboxymethylaminomethyl modification radical SAM/GNAT enzyme Elp3 [Patescibacteria group bacterium]|nr:tRNA uridine(34) 5-carboxymethylaminomethyl modification radical SAM/GNAT enzyme Elp3 [Patescibacteria group bacterium]
MMIGEIIKQKPKTAAELMALKRKLVKKGEELPRHSELWREYLLLVKSGRVKFDEKFARLLKRRAVRTLSGVAPVAVLTKPWKCPGKCAFCPTEKNVPKSYLSNEPAVMRAIRNKYDPYEQVRTRLEALEINGHRPEKIELIVIGGTWSVLPRAYKFWFIKECFRAANEFSSQSRGGDCDGALNKKSPLERGGLRRARRGVLKLEETKKQLFSEQKKNEKAKYKIIGITLETRPDYIDEKELIEMRELGATRVELGVQAVDDKILAKNNRGHGVAEIVRATELLKNFGFKVTYHLMPGLPGATAKKDLAMFKQSFSDERFQPDQIKFYPTVVTKGSKLYRWWKAGKYRPYSDKVLRQLIIDCKKAVPEYVRIIRLIRDIPGESIEAGNTITNLRQVMQQEGARCRCIRCREVKDKTIKAGKLKLNIQEYPASGGQEYFISFDSQDGKTLYGFCRLRLPFLCHPESLTKDLFCKNADFIQSKFFIAKLKISRTIDPSRGAQDDKKIADEKYSFLNNSAIVRELHVYGELVPVGGRTTPKPLLEKEGGIQHGGLGRKLLAEAEKIARQNNFNQIAVIAGIGTRGYYKKLGYRLEEGYMVKKNGQN